MSRKLSLKFIQKSYQAIFCVILLSVTMTGCTSLLVSSKGVRAEKYERKNNSNNSVSGKVPAELVGKWKKVQSSGYADYAKYAENMGNFESYEIMEDGRVRNETLIAAKSYDCPVQTTTRSEGTITLTSDSMLNIHLDAGTIQQANGCSPEKSYADSTKETSTDFQWKMSRDEAGTTELYLTQPNGETICYRRAA